MSSALIKFSMPVIMLACLMLILSCFMSIKKNTKTKEVLKNLIISIIILSIGLTMAITGIKLEKEESKIDNNKTKIEENINQNNNQKIENEVKQ